MFGVISSFIGLLFLFYIILNKNANRFLIVFTFSKFLQAGGVFLFSIRDSIPDYLSLNTGGVLLILGYAMEVFIVISYDNIFRKNVFLTFILPILPTFVLFLVFTQIPLYQITLVFSFLAAYYFTSGSFILYNRKEKTQFVMLVSITYLLFSLAYIVQIINIIIEGENYVVLSGEGPFQIGLYVFASLNLIIGSVGYLLMIKELDEKRIREKNLRIEQDNQMLKELNFKKDKFFSIIAHDLKSPIGALIQLGHILQEDHDNIPAKQREKIIRSISGGAGRTYDLLENLLQWSRSESGNLRVRIKEINIKDIIVGVLQLLKENIRQKKITVSNEITDDLYVLGDVNMINTVIRNLISNAIKYVHVSGHIAIRNKKDFQQHQAIIFIQDDGVGIKPEIIKKLFDIDSDYTSRGTNNESGTGLGLKLCREFMIKNNGDIKVSSELGKGSLFEITLSLASLRKTVSV